MVAEKKAELTSKQLIEDLADLEHQQWMLWSKEIASKEKLSKKRLKRWKKLWKPYKELTEKEKEQDRIWAKKVLKTQYKSTKKELKRQGGNNSSKN